MKQITIKKFQPSEETWSILLEIRNAFLQIDPEWHFFWEGQITFIRCGAAFAPLVSGYLHGRGYESETTEYAENIVPEPWQDIFVKVFHLFSELTLRMSGELKETELVTDRVFHSFMNMSMVPMWRIYGKQMLMEPTVMMNHALMRAYTLGMLVAEFKAKEKENGRANQGGV